MGRYPNGSFAFCPLPCRYHEQHALRSAPVRNSDSFKKNCLKNGKFEIPGLKGKKNIAAHAAYGVLKNENSKIYKRLAVDHDA